MEKIEFKNGQAPYINDANLNQLQDNIEEAIDSKSSLPEGGTTGQVLAKASNEDNDVEWVNQTGGGNVTGDTVPIGAVMEWDSNTIPINWLLLNGQAVSRTEYNELFELYGTYYGEGDGSTTFNLPDRRKYVPVGLDENDDTFNELGKKVGEKEHTLTIDEMPSHYHQLHASSKQVASGNVNWVIQYIGDQIAGDSTTSVGKSQPHNNIQPSFVTNFIVKAKQSAGVVATVVDNLNSDSETDALSAKQGKALNEKIVGTVLYENETGITGDVTLSDSVANYDYIEIQSSKGNAFLLSSARFYKPNGKKVVISGTYTENLEMYMYSKIVTINGNKINVIKTNLIYMSNTSTQVMADDSNCITRVVGYKE